MATQTPKPENPKPLLNAPVRLVGWAGAATLAVAVLALTLQSKAGSERLPSALATTDSPPTVPRPEPPLWAGVLRLREGGDGTLPRRQSGVPRRDDGRTHDVRATLG